MKKQASAVVPTLHGSFEVIAYSSEESDKMPHLAILHPDAEINGVVPIRIHSECFTGDVLHSLKCDCGDQLNMALAYIQKHKGLLIYLRQEGRGIGLINKLKAYKLQEEGLNTVDANLHLGFQADQREYQLAIEILKDLKIKQIDLITNNPKKIEAIEDSGIRLNARIALNTLPTAENKEYLETKQKLMGHKIKF